MLRAARQNGPSDKTPGAVVRGILAATNEDEDEEDRDEEDEDDEDRDEYKDRDVVTVPEPYRRRVQL